MTSHKYTDEPVGTLVTSVSEWGAAGTHDPLLPSGARVKMRILDLPHLIETGEIPQHLLDVAIGVATDPEKTPDKDMIVKAREFEDAVAILSVVEPKLDETSVRQIPYEDKGMLVAWATRARDVDAQGDHIAGLTKSEKFRRFRRLGEFDADVADL